MLSTEFSESLIESQFEFLNAVNAWESNLDQASEDFQCMFCAGTEL